MDGSYPTNMNNEPKETIGKWMLSIIANGGVSRHDDLHVDDINESWSNRDTWVEAGFQALLLGTALRDEHGLNFTVVLAYSLDASRDSCKTTYKRPETLQENMDWSPPSLYLFPRGKEPWTEIEVAVGDVDLVIVERYQNVDKPWIKYWCYMELKLGEEFLRSVFAAG